jgi:hypothetical protein
MKKNVGLFFVFLIFGCLNVFAQGNLTGIWKFEADVNRLVGTDGFIKKTSVSYEWVIRLKQQGSKLTGEVVGGRGGTKRINPCKEADVAGWVRGETINLIITWQGSCCPDEQSKFTGEIDSDGKIVGSVVPVDVPKDFGCSLEYADVIASKRGADSDDDDDSGTSRSIGANLGVWDFQVEVNRMVGSDGFIKRVNTSFELVVRLNQRDGKITGEVVGGRGGRKGETVCADAEIEGTIIGRSVTFVITYQGSCCNGEQLRFSGSFSNNYQTLSGTIEPVDVPKLFCSLEYGDVTATKR